jgi:hypothetical protein
VEEVFDYMINLLVPSSRANANALFYFKATAVSFRVSASLAKDPMSGVFDFGAPFTAANHLHPGGDSVFTQSK